MKIEIYRHEFEGDEWFTDSPDPYARNVRTFAPYGDPEGFWLEVKDKQFITSPRYEYWPAYGCLVEMDS